MAAVNSRFRTSGSIATVDCVLPSALTWTNPLPTVRCLLSGPLDTTEIRGGMPRACTWNDRGASANASLGLTWSRLLLVPCRLALPAGVGWRVDVGRDGRRHAGDLLQRVSELSGRAGVLGEEEHEERYSVAGSYCM
jgi:hypothetical protein